MERTLSHPVTVSFDYTRSTGPALGRFFAGLRERRFVGGRTASGEVLVPPAEFDPVDHRPTGEFVEVSDHGTVVSWCWVPEPVAGQPFDRPFAFALIRLDGADGAFPHAVDVASPEEIETGMRVRAVWIDEPRGEITDVTFAPDEPAAPVEPAAPDKPVEVPGDIPAPEPTTLVTPVSLDYRYAASPEESAFFRGLAEGRIVGQRCPVCSKVYVPPRGACPSDGVPTHEEVELSHRGTVTTFCIVNVPFLGQKITPPYVSAYILLDGADIALQHILQGVEADRVRMGMRVEASWRPAEEWTTSIENIEYFRPSGEPDADYATYRHHL